MSYSTLNSDLVNLLGQSQQIFKETSKTSFIRDPFHSALFQFIRYCLQETAVALHQTVVFTYKQQPKTKQKHFFLSGFKAKTSWNTSQWKIFGNPEECKEGHDMKWLLKNLRLHWKEYALQMNLYEDVLDDITGFLLFDIIQKGLIYDDDSKNGIVDVKFVKDCYDACLEMLSAIIESEYYKEISQAIEKIKQNIEAMLLLIPEYEVFVKQQEHVAKEELLTGKVIDFLKDNSLAEALRKEEMIKSSKPTEKPLTNYFLFTVIPRFAKHQLTSSSDSGVVVDDMSDVLTSGSADTSLVVIDGFQSTPVAVKNKVVDRLRLKDKSTLGKLTGKSDTMDGSFVLL